MVDLKSHGFLAGFAHDCKLSLREKFAHDCAGWLPDNCQTIAPEFGAKKTPPKMAGLSIIWFWLWF